MPVKRILILGGTGDARALASRLVALKQDVVTSLAGVTADPLLPEGRLRRGGFGGAEGLAAYIRAEGIDVLVDATHPFAAQISANAAAASASTGVKLVRLERPQWVAEAGDDWRDVAGMDEAVAAIPPGASVFVSTGRKGLGTLFARDDLHGVIRAIEPIECAVPGQWTVLLERPPFSFQHEMQLLQHHCIGLVLTKNAGGATLTTKLLAARALRIPVLMIARPAKPSVPAFSSIDALLAALL